MANFVLLGPPGSGKGTQAKIIAEKLDLPHISMGDILREEVRKKSPLGIKVEGILKVGKLVPDEVTFELARERLNFSDCGKGFIFDGYPRTLVQAEALEKILGGLGKSVDKVVYFSLPLNSVVERLSLRRSCKKCGAVYHLKYAPPKTANKCDACGGDLYLRHDDEENVIKNRFEVYLKQTKPLIDYYKKKNVLIEIDASKLIEEITKDIFKGLNV